MAEPVHTTVLQTLHVGGGWLAFALAPVALLVRKGSRRHIFAGRGFVLALTVGITAGLLLAMIDRVVGLFFFGLLTLFLLGTGYLAPHIARGSRRGYRLDRALTGLGAIGSLGLIGDGLIGMTSPYEGLSFGGLGLAIVVAHARWRGPKDPSRWQAEHLTSMLAAYTVGWTFILGLYVPRLTAQSRLAVPILGLAGILWARRRFGHPAIGTKPGTALTGAA